MLSWWALKRYGLALIAATGLQLITIPVRDFLTVSDVMLLGVACVTFFAFRFGKAEAIVASITSVLLVDVFHVQPYYTLAVHNIDYFVSFCVMLAVGIFIAQLAQQNRLSEQERREAERLKDRESIRANLLRSIGHDLRTPLGTIMGASSLISDETLQLPPHRYQEQARNIYQQSLILKNQIDKMLELSRIRDLESTHIWSEVPAEDLVSAALARSNQEARDKFIIHCHVDSLIADSALIEIALANLIDNAFVHGEPPFEIHLFKHGGAYQVRVCNSPCQRPLKRQDAGTGLGLLICDAVAKLHNGRFEFNNDGSVVTATLIWNA